MHVFCRIKLIFFFDRQDQVECGSEIHIVARVILSGFHFSHLKREIKIVVS